jgi:hypothetical protein
MNLGGRELVTIQSIHFCRAFKKLGYGSRHLFCQNWSQSNNWGYVMDAKVSHKPCSCSSFKILYILLGLKPVQHLGRVLLF